VDLEVGPAIGALSSSRGCEGKIESSELSDVEIGVMGAMGASESEIGAIEASTGVILGAGEVRVESGCIAAV
jgi:hypothetical protein